ncbi:MAG: hypothetical protein C0593_10725 [Marinilabiliales bacterium]|nr:MAG: hypothetical protein C0593_10725 [Marinilabiliales bacterium]
MHYSKNCKSIKHSNNTKSHSIMKKSYIKLLPALMLIVGMLSGCVSTKMPGSYDVEPETLENDGGKITVKVEGTIPEKTFHKKAVVEFTPVMKYDGKEKELKSMTLKGEKAEGNGQVISTKEGGSFTYNTVIDYEPGMEEAVLVVEPVITKKGKVQETAEVKLADGTIMTSQFVMHNEDVWFASRENAAKLGMKTDEYYELVTPVSETATFYFLVNRSNINYNLDINKEMNVKDQLDALQAFIDQGWEVKNIEINAFASPEGEESFNEGLSEKRSESGMKILKKIYKNLLKDDEATVKVENPEEEYTITSRGLGEDWNGFIKAVEASNLKDKSIVLNVVKSQTNPLQKEQEIRNMTLVYNEIADEILPPLRRVEFKVTCFEPKKTAEEIANLAVNNPSELSLKELIYAGTLTDDFNTKLQIYKSAADMFPKDWKAQNNVAATYLSMFKAEEAVAYLEKANELSPNNPMVVNNMGAAASKAKDYDNAMSLFNKAKGLGVDVAYNVAIIDITKGKYAAAMKVLKDKECNYNKALVQVLEEEYDAASKTLKCGEESCMGHYLMAVIAARTDNKTTMVEYLAKAIKMNPKFAMKAAVDREFVRFFDDPLFMEAVK